MSSLAVGISRNGSLRFFDANRNGLVDDGDRLDVNLAATGSPTMWDTYQLTIGGLFAAPETYVACTRFILNGPMGPFDIPLPDTRLPRETALRRGHLRDDVYLEDRRASRIWTSCCDFGRPLLRASRRLIWERDPLQPADHPEQRSLALPNGCERKRPARFWRYVPCRRPIEPDLGDLESGPRQYERRRHLLGRRLRRADRADSDAHVHRPRDEPVAGDPVLPVLESCARPEPGFSNDSPLE